MMDVAVLTTCLRAVNDSAGKGVVIAIGDNKYMWHDRKFDNADNEELLDNIFYFKFSSGVYNAGHLRYLCLVCSVLCSCC